MDKTDWDDYYRKPYKTALFTRRITGNVLAGLIKKYCSPLDTWSILELGGANSCFYDLLKQQFNPAFYTVLDNNILGLDRFKERIGADEKVITLHKDIFTLEPEEKYDLTYSVGLIEHFTPEDTQKAIAAHFTMTRRGGIVLISFPTPTFLYRITRGVAQALKVWIFHDERPLTQEEVIETVRHHGELLDQKIIWPIFLTQAMIVARKY